MSKKFILENIEYDSENLTPEGKARIVLLKYCNQKITELHNMHALLPRAKVSYMDSLKKEILAQKSGFLFEQD